MEQYKPFNSAAEPTQEQLAAAGVSAAPAAKKTGAAFGIIAGILYGVMTVLSFWTDLSSYNLTLFTLLQVLAYGCIALFLFLRMPVGTAAGAGALALSSVITLLYNTVFMGYPLNITYVLQVLLSIACYVLLAVIAGARLAKPGNKAIAFLPAGLYLLSYIITVFTNSGVLAYYWQNTSFISAEDMAWLAQLVFYVYIAPFIVLIALVFAGLWLPYASRPKAAAAPAGAGTVQPPAAEGYCGMFKHFFLLIFTFGIWLCIWIYRTTRFLNRVQDEPPRKPARKLLLCMFIPFYYIYWIYRSAQRMDKLMNRSGIPANGATFQLLMAFFAPGVCPIMLQDKINTVVMKEAAAQYRQPVQPQDTGI